MQSLSLHSLQKRKVVLAWFLILPVLVLRVFTALYPMVMTFVYSFMNYNLMSRTKSLAGLVNFIRMSTDLNVQESLAFTFIFTVCSIAFHVLLGVLLALALNVDFGGRKFLRSIVLIPWAIPMIVAGIAAQWMFNDQFGMVNDILYRIAGIKPIWLVTRTSARFVVTVTDVWKDTPFFAILILAGLQGISGEVYESAVIDGASRWTSFWRITVPYLTPIIATLTTFFALWRLSSFDLVYAMTKGGPGSATSLLSYRVYMSAFNHLDLGYGSSISVVLFLVMGVIAILGFSLQRTVDY
jgi:multiple sugar transport system permease protein